MKLEYLLKPGKVGTLELKNRIVMPAMGTRLSGVNGEVTDKQLKWYSRRAKGGAALIITEVCAAATALDPVRINPLPFLHI